MLAQPGRACVDLTEAYGSPRWILTLFIATAAAAAVTLVDSGAVDHKMALHLVGSKSEIIWSKRFNQPRPMSASGMLALTLIDGPLVKMSQNPNSSPGEASNLKLSTLSDAFSPRSCFVMVQIFGQNKTHRLTEGRRLSFKGKPAHSNWRVIMWRVFKLWGDVGEQISRNWG